MNRPLPSKLALRMPSVMYAQLGVPIVKIDWRRVIVHLDAEDRDAIEARLNDEWSIWPTTIYTHWSPNLIPFESRFPVQLEQWASSFLSWLRAHGCEATMIYWIRFLHEVPERFLHYQRCRLQWHLAAAQCDDFDFEMAIVSLAAATNWGGVGWSIPESEMAKA